MPEADPFAAWRTWHVFFSYQLLSSSVVGSRAAATSSARNCIFWAMRRLTISSFLSRPIASRLAVEHFGLHLLLHQAAELFRCRVAPPLRLEQHGQLGEFVDRQLNLLRRWRRAAGRLQVVVRGEQRGSDEQEMNQGFTQQALHEISATVRPQLSWLRQRRVPALRLAVRGSSLRGKA